MYTESQCPPEARYLTGISMFSDKAIRLWQAECRKRCQEKEKGPDYEQYIHWERRANQAAVFTLYAYADLFVPKIFDCIFRCDDPACFVQTPYTLTQSIHEAWFPVGEVGNGHKHLCIFTFEESVPGVLQTLHLQQGQFFTASFKDAPTLGFCSMTNYEAIKARQQKIITLKKLHGNQWPDYDED